MGVPTLTIRQPWASLIMAGIKTIENRSWPPPPKYVGKRIVIHAGGLLELDALERPWVKPYVAQLPNPLPRGAAIGTVLITPHTIPPGSADHLGRREKGDPLLEWWIPDHHGWVLADPRPFREPVRAPGTMGIWFWEPPPGFQDQFLPQIEPVE